MSHFLVPKGVLQEKFGRGVWPTSQNSLPYLWPEQKFDTLFKTNAADTVALNIVLKAFCLWPH